jgi:hypothetical protein
LIPEAASRQPEEVQEGGIVRGFFKSILILWCVLFSKLLAAQEVRIRNPNENKTSCGVYLAKSSLDTTTGEKIAELTRESLDKFFASNPDLGPRLVATDKRNGKLLSTDAEIDRAIREGHLEFRVDEPVLFGVGLPISRRDQKEFQKMVREASEGRVDNPVNVRIISKPKWRNLGGPKWARPVMAAVEFGDYLRQELVYVFPMKSNDYQAPVRAEFESTKAKLWTSNTVQQLIITAQALFGDKVTIAAALAGGLVNYGNSYVTGIYRKVISNWLLRAKRADNNTLVGKVRHVGEAFVRNLLLSSFFTIQIYWMSKMFEWSKFAQIGTAEGWYHMLVTKWSSAVINVLWRYFFYDAITKFESRMESMGRKEDARRTAARFELLGSLLATPAFLISSMADPKSGWIIPIFKDFSLQLTPAHGVMLAVGGLFAAFSAGVIKMDPWVERFDWIHSKVLSLAQRLGLRKKVDDFEKATRKPFETRRGLDEGFLPGEAEGSAPVQYEDLREQVGARLLEVLKLDPALRRIVDSNPELRKKLSMDRSLLELFSVEKTLPVRAD